MTVLLDRWQFGVTITYHFLFVPLTIGLAFLVAIMQVLAYRRKDAVWCWSTTVTCTGTRRRALAALSSAKPAPTITTRGWKALMLAAPRLV